MRLSPARLCLFTLFLAPAAMAADSMPDIEIYIARHGKTMLNASDQVQGWSDAVLTPQGQRQAISLGRGLAKHGIHFTAAYSSDTWPCLANSAPGLGPQRAGPLAGAHRLALQGVQFRQL